MVVVTGAERAVTTVEGVDAYRGGDHPYSGRRYGRRGVVRVPDLRSNSNLRSNFRTFSHVLRVGKDWFHGGWARLDPTRLWTPSAFGPPDTSEGHIDRN